MTGHTESRLSRLIDWIRHSWCGLHGHDTLLHFERQRMFLECVSCGHQSPGWELNGARPVELNQARPVMTLRAEPRTASVARPRLITARRVA